MPHAPGRIRQVRLVEFGHCPTAGGHAGRSLASMADEEYAQLMFSPHLVVVRTGR